MSLVALGGGGLQSLPLASYSITLKAKDTAAKQNGPNGRGCGKEAFEEDLAKFDGNFTCNCANDNAYSNANCGITAEAAAGDSGDSGVLTAVVGAVLGLIVVLVVLVYAKGRYTAYQEANAPADFGGQLQALKDQGLASTEGGDRIPRELPRSSLTMVEKLGRGNFGEVWKGMLADVSAEFMVAAKIVLDTEGSGDEAAFAAAEVDLQGEALLMAQVDTHQNLVSLVGVITRGQPKVIVISYCEHGDLQKALKKRATDGNAFDASTKLRFCAEVAGGMGHLAQHYFVHRDLAARNVMLSSGMVCKVADFGLSRQVLTEDNTDDCESASRPSTRATCSNRLPVAFACHARALTHGDAAPGRSRSAPLALTPTHMSRLVASALLARRAYSQITG